MPAICPDETMQLWLWMQRQTATTFMFALQVVLWEMLHLLPDTSLACLQTWTSICLKVQTERKLQPYIICLVKYMCLLPDRHVIVRQTWQTWQIWVANRLNSLTAKNLQEVWALCCTYRLTRTLRAHPSASTRPLLCSWSIWRRAARLVCALRSLCLAACLPWPAYDCSTCEKEKKSLHRQPAQRKPLSTEAAWKCCP